MTIDVLSTLQAAGDFPLASYLEFSETPNPNMRIARSSQDEEIGVVQFTGDGDVYTSILEVDIPELRPTFLRRATYIPNNDVRGQPPSEAITEAHFLGTYGSSSNTRLILLANETVDADMFSGLWLYFWFPLTTIAGESLGDPAIPTPVGTQLGPLVHFRDLFAFGDRSNQIDSIIDLDNVINLEVDGRMGRVYRSISGGFNLILAQFGGYVSRLERLSVRQLNRRTFFAGSPVSDQLPEADGAVGDVNYNLDPPLPKGLDFDSKSRMITGVTPEPRALSRFRYGAEDRSGHAVFSELDIEVEKALEIPVIPTIEVDVGADFAVTLPEVDSKFPVNYQVELEQARRHIVFDYDTRIISGSFSRDYLFELIYTAVVQGIATVREFAIAVRWRYIIAVKPWMQGEQPNFVEEDFHPGSSTSIGTVTTDLDVPRVSGPPNTRFNMALAYAVNTPEPTGLVADLEDGGVSDYWSLLGDAQEIGIRGVPYMMKVRNPGFPFRIDTLEHTEDFRVII